MFLFVFASVLILKCSYSYLSFTSNYIFMNLCNNLNFSVRFFIYKCIYETFQSALREFVAFSHYPSPTVSSVWVERSRPSVCLSVCLYVCLSVCPQHNSKTNDPKVFKLGGIP